jgi:hypothetical protein
VTGVTPEFVALLGLQSAVVVTVVVLIAREYVERWRRRRRLVDERLDD